MVATATSAGSSPKGLSSLWPLHCKRLGLRGLAGTSLLLKATGVERLGVGKVNVSNIICRMNPHQTGRHQPPWRNVSKIFFENRSSGGVVELGRHQPPHRSVSEISEEIEATEVPAEAIAQAVSP